MTVLAAVAVARPGSIPSPSSGVLELGPLSIHAYGLMIALGVVAGVWLTGRRFEARGAGTRDDVSGMAVWAVLAGIVGSRLYHVITDWSSFEDDPVRIVQIWKGGLGIPGGLLAGITVGWWVTRRRGLDPRIMATCAAPAIALAQSIGRWGNYFNQELFGRPTDLPWALEIDESNIPLGFAPDTTFHPTFLYESLWNLALCGLLIWIDRRYRLRPPRLMGVYLLGYGIGRFWVEGLRIDEADELGGLRWNQWVALTVAVAALVYLVVSGRRDTIAATDPATDPASDSASDDPKLDDSAAADTKVTATDVDEVDGTDPDAAEADGASAPSAVSVSGVDAEQGYVAADERHDEH